MVKTRVKQQVTTFVFVGDIEPHGTHVEVPKVPCWVNQIWETQPRFKSGHFLQIFANSKLIFLILTISPTETHVLRIEVHSSCRKMHGAMIP